MGFFAALRSPWCLCLKSNLDSVSNLNKIRAFVFYRRMPKLSPSAIEKNKSRIEEAARKLFIKQGFHATSMRNIAARAGTSLGNVYNYYRTKEEILGSIISKYQTDRAGRPQRSFA